MSISLPPPPARKLTPAEAAAVAKRARKLLRAGRITHRQHVLLDCLLWSCRNPISGAIVVSYAALERLTRLSRSTIAEALAVLERLRVLTRIKRRVRLAWHQGGQQCRQIANAYLLHPPAHHCEFGERTVIQSDSVELLHVQRPNADVTAARAALAQIAAQRRSVIAARLLTKGGGLPAGAT